ncbi:MAG: NAD(P)H-hydrate dehydratase [Thiobacillus sp.]|nr:NAD(P)H-hydrate dehydratase [Thiobacillus sp.]
MHMTRVIVRAEVKAALKPRPRECHKGDFGNVGILGGAPGMAGAALLAGRAALWLGAGRVYVGLLDDRLGVDATTPELMLAAPDRVLGLAPPGCLVAGPGLGQSAGARGWLEAALATPLPLLLDADALNLIAADSGLADRLRSRTGPALLTPHPGEAGRLIGRATAAVQADRGAALADLVDRYRCGVLLKGADSLIGFPGREGWRNVTGNPGMAAPGMGDVLAGMIAALVGQGLDMERAAVIGTWLHGAAGDRAVRAGCGPLGLTAGEVARAARDLINELIYSGL